LDHQDVHLKHQAPHVAAASESAPSETVTATATPPEQQKLGSIMKEVDGVLTARVAKLVNGSKSVTAATYARSYCYFLCTFIRRYYLYLNYLFMIIELQHSSQELQLNSRK